MCIDHSMLTNVYSCRNVTEWRCLSRVILCFFPFLSHPILNSVTITRIYFLSLQVLLSWRIISIELQGMWSFVSVFSHLTWYLEIY
jgi:hypothetical protein